MKYVARGVSLRAVALVLAIASFAAVHFANAQTPGSPPANPASDERNSTRDPTDDRSGESGGLQRRPAEVARQVLPETMYVRDKDGHLVPILVDMTYEEFAELYELKRSKQEPEIGPQYVIDTLSMSAHVQPAGNGGANGAVAWRARLALHILTDALVRIPLSFRGKHLTEPPVFTGAGDYRLQYLSGAGGYVLWLRAEGGSEHQIDLSFVSDLASSGSELQTRLNAPTATKSELSFHVPGRDMFLRSSDSSTIVQQEVMEETTRFQIVGLGSDTQLSWRNREVDILPQENPFEVRGETLVEVRGPGSLLVDAHLAIMTYGRPLRQLRVQFPPRVRLLSPMLTEAYQITWEGLPSGKLPTDLQDGNIETGEGPVAVVTFETPNQVPADLPLLFDQNVESDGGDLEIKVGTVRVLGALRHYGTVTITTEGDWRLTWEPVEGLTRLWELPTRWQSKSVVAAFAYFRQPFQLPLRVTAKATRLHADPIMVYRVGLSEIELQGIFRLRVSGAAASTIRVEMPGWQLTGFADPEFVDLESLDADKTSPLEVPLSRPRTGTLNMEISATKLIDDVARLAVLDIPRVLDATSSAPLIILVPHDDVSLNSLVDLTNHVTTENIPPGLEGIEELGRAICFRYRGNSDAVGLRYEVRPRKQVIRVQANMSVRWEASGPPYLLECIQRIRYDVRHSPLNDILLRLPPSDLLAHPPMVLVDGDELKATTEPSATPDPTVAVADGTDNRAADSEANDVWPVTNYSLPYPRSSLFEVEVRYAVTGPTSLTTAPAPFSIPVVQSASGEITEQRVEILAPESIAIQHPGTDYQTIDPGGMQADGTPRPLTLETTLPSSTLKLNLAQKDTNAALGTSVEMSVLQTWATANARRDRCVFRVRSSSNEIVLTLPSNATVDQLQVVVDGQSIAHQRGKQSDIIVPLNPSLSTYHTLELVYPVAGHAQRLGKVAVPSIQGSRWLGRFFWHLVLPSHQRLVSAPDVLESEDPWHRHGLYWARQSPGIQSKWEDWLASTHQTPPPNVANEYFFSGFGNIQYFEVSTGRGSWFILATVGVLIVGILGLPRLPSRVRGTAIITLALACLVFGLWHPVTGLLLMQAGGTVVAVLLIWQGGHWMVSHLAWRWRHYPGAFAVPRFDSLQPPSRDNLGSSRVSIASTAAHPPIPSTAPDSHLQ